ncbi:MAG: threonine synthase, partial [Acidimicrobiia bacterium]|nr:threonine synthase [Acidimicrobiia bacterium]
MRYFSTRGGAPPVSFAEAMIQGLAPDGGLYVPEVAPALEPGQLSAWRDLSYADLATEIVSLMAPDIGRDTIAAACRSAYNSD